MSFPVNKSILSTDAIKTLEAANLLKANGQLEEAALAMQEIIKQHPDFAAAFNNLGTIYYSQSKFQNAMDAFYKAIDLQPDYADAYYNLGLAYSRLHRYDEAMNAFQALIALNSAHPGGHFQLGCLFMQRDQNETAIKHFSVVGKSHPQHFETQANLAAIYLKQGQLSDAKKHYLNAIDILPTDLQSLFNLGVISAQQGLLDDAIGFYLRAINLNPDYFEALNNLGAVYLAKKDQQTALQYFREALRLQPKNVAVRHTVDILLKEKNITSSPPDYIRSLFDSYADHYDTHLAKELHYQVPEVFHTLLKDKLGGQAQLNVLDLGCGTGLCGEYVKPFAKTLIGIDLSPNMLAIAKEKKVYDELIEAEIISFLAAHKAQYDLIMAGDVLIYFGDLDPVFAAVRETLTPKGTFIFSIEVENSGDYHFSASGRFTHSKAYVDKLAADHQFKVLAYQTVAIRSQDEQAVSGHVYLLQR